MLKSIQNAANLARQASHIKAKQGQISKLLAEVEATGFSANKKVQVTVNGNREIVRIYIDPSIIDFEYENFTSKGKEPTTLSKSIIEAFKEASKEIEKKSAQVLQESGAFNDFKSMLDMASGT